MLKLRVYQSVDGPVFYDRTGRTYPAFQAKAGLIPLGVVVPFEVVTLFNPPFVPVFRVIDGGAE